MEETKKAPITVTALVNAPLKEVWDKWTLPEHITKWCFAADTWHAPSAENDLHEGGRFMTRMEARDGSFGFDFGGIYTQVSTHQCIAYILADERTVRITFTEENGATYIEEVFDPENENPVEMQRDGWQAILNNFKKYAES